MCTGTPIGELCFAVEEDKILALHTRERLWKTLTGIREGPHAQAFEKELKEYFKGERKSFTFKPVITGSSFKKKVLEEVTKIPYGSTTTYKKLAEKLSTSPRAIASVLRANNILIIVPCHRVVMSSGDPGGYIIGKEAKLTLLRLEHIFV